LNILPKRLVINYIRILYKLFYVTKGALILKDLDRLKKLLFSRCCLKTKFLMKLTQNFVSALVLLNF